MIIFLFKGRGKEKVKPSTQKTEPLNAVNKIIIRYVHKKERWNFSAEASQPGLHTGTESYPN